MGAIWQAVRRLLGARRVVAVVAAAAFVVVLWVCLVVGPSRLGAGETFEERKAQNDVRTTLLQGLGGAVLGVGAYFTARQLRTAQHGQVIAREGQITERYTRAVDQLGHAEVDVRIGGVYALERIARDSPHDQATIGEVLTSFVRGRSPWPPTRPGQFVATASLDKVTELQARNADVQAAIAVLCRSANALDLDLHQVDLRKANLTGAHLEGATLTGAHLEGATLTGAHLEGANLARAHLQRANLADTHLQRANLFDAHLEGSVLIGAHLEGANLQGAHLEKAHLVDAHLEKANLLVAHLEGANLFDAHLEGATLTGAHLEETNLFDAHLEGATLIGAHLEGTILAGAHLEGATLIGADLEGTILAGAHLEGANFARAHLEGTDLDGVVCNDSTIWPDGFELSKSAPTSDDGPAGASTGD